MSRSAKLTSRKMRDISCSLVELEIEVVAVAITGAMGSPRADFKHRNRYAQPGYCNSMLMPLAIQFFRLVHPIGSVDPGFL